MSELEPLAEGLEKVFGKLGLPDPKVMSAVMEEWAELAGPPWTGKSKPVVVRGHTLVVEASSPSQVAFLRYGITKLLTTLGERFGEGVITDVDVVPPRR
ncbi:MAG TPA: DUF721 domain-containing protein [Acidimicrobiia bacterium]